MALRGHASIQGSTDIPTLFNLLPGYLPMPNAGAARRRCDDYVDAIRQPGPEGLLGQRRRLHRQPAQGLVGRRGDGRERLLLRLPAPAHRRPRHLPDRARHARRQGQGLLPARPEPGRRLGARPSCSGSAWPTSTGSSCATSSMIESATFWKDAPEIATGELAHRGHRHRGVLPARRRRTSRRTARSPRPSGCCSGTTRRSSRRATAARELWFFYHLGPEVRERLAGSTDERDRPLLDLTWDYPRRGEHGEPDAEAVLRGDQRLPTGRRRGRPLLDASPR